MLKVLALAALFPAAAFAWPVDGFIDVDPGKEKLVKFGALDFAAIDDPKIAEVEVMPDSGELLVTAKKEGRALVHLWAQGRSAVWWVRVGSKAVDEPQVWDAVKKACRGADPGPKDLVVEVNANACRQALQKALMQDRYLPPATELTFDVKVLQSQLAEMQQALAVAKVNVKVRYEGAGLILEGSVDEPTRRRAYFELFKTSAGRLAVSDRLVVIAEVDAGTSAAGKGR